MSYLIELVITTCPQMGDSNVRHNICWCTSIMIFYCSLSVDAKIFSHRHHTLIVLLDSLVYVYLILFVFRVRFDLFISLVQFSLWYCTRWILIFGLMLISRSLYLVWHDAKGVDICICVHDVHIQIHLLTNHCNCICSYSCCVLPGTWRENNDNAGILWNY